MGRVLFPRACKQRQPLESRVPFFEIEADLKAYDALPCPGNVSIIGTCLIAQEFEFRRKPRIVIEERVKNRIQFL